MNYLFKTTCTGLDQFLNFRSFISDINNLVENQAGNSQQKIDYYLTRTNDKNTKNRLKEVTQEGLDMGMFGAPSYIVRQEGEEDKLFFGQGKILCVHS